jgi:hypothetical protein
MTAKTVKVAKKKKAPKKKTSSVKVTEDNLWVDLNIPGKDIEDGIMPHTSSTTDQIVAGYTQFLIAQNQILGANFKIIKILWRKISGVPRYIKLKVYVSPKPTLGTGPDGGNAVVKPPPPPPPPPPYLG